MRRAGGRRGRETLKSNERGRISHDRFPLPGKTEMDQASSADDSGITLRIKFKSESVDQFIARYGTDVSPGGIFIRTREPLGVGTSLRFEFSLAGGQSLLAGHGTVVWVREPDQTRAGVIPGMGVRFDKLSPESQTAL